MIKSLSLSLSLSNQSTKSHSFSSCYFDSSKCMLRHMIVRHQRACSHYKVQRSDYSPPKLKLLSMFGKERNGKGEQFSFVCFTRQKEGKEMDPTPCTTLSSFLFPSNSEGKNGRPHGSPFPPFSFLFLNFYSTKQRTFLLIHTLLSFSPIFFPSKHSQKIGIWLQGNYKDYYALYLYG